MGKKEIKLIRNAPLIRIPSYEWGKLILALRREGYTKRCIMHATGLSEFTYEKVLREHKEPSHFAGEVILKLNERISHDSKHSHCNLSQELS